jgi:7,8-dihydroneopterin aldolase/epimerase/oxygenase
METFRFGANSQRLADALLTDCNKYLLTGEWEVNAVDVINLRGISCYGYHGVLSEERALGQRFVVNLRLYLDVRRAAATDDVRDTVNYAEVYQHVKHIVEGQPKNLLETVAEAIAKRLLENYELLEGVSVEIEKPSAPIPGTFESVSVWVERWRRG